MRPFLVLLPLALSCAPAKPSAAVDIERCGAVAIAPKLALTAGHCVRWIAGTHVVWRPKAPVAVPHEALTIAADRERDLAWLHSEDSFPAFVPVRRGVSGETVRAVSPVYDWATVRGTLGRETFLGGEPDGGTCDGLTCRGVLYWETNLTIKPGWSGSPVFGEDGAVIGVVSSCQGFAQWKGLRLEKSCKPGFALVAGL